MMNHVKEMAERELHKLIERGELASTTIPIVRDLTEIIKNVDKIEMLEGEMEEMGGSSKRGYSREGGGSNRGYSQDGGSYRGGSSYDGYSEESSYRRRRDRMGRYSRGDGKDHMMHQLGEMMRDADENEREVLERCMRELERNS